VNTILRKNVEIIVLAIILALLVRPLQDMTGTLAHVKWMVLLMVSFIGARMFGWSNFPLLIVFMGGILASLWFIIAPFV